MICGVVDGVHHGTPRHPAGVLLSPVWTAAFTGSFLHHRHRRYIPLPYSVEVRSPPTQRRWVWSWDSGCIAQLLNSHEVSLRAVDTSPSMHSRYHILARPGDRVAGKPVSKRHHLTSQYTSPHPAPLHSLTHRSPPTPLSSRKADAGRPSRSKARRGRRKPPSG